MKIKLPVLTREEKFGTSTKKNVIIHLVCDEIEKDFEVVSFQRGKLQLKDSKEVGYYITTNKNDVPDVGFPKFRPLIVRVFNPFDC